MRKYAILAMMLLGIGGGSAWADYLILVAKVGGGPMGDPSMYPEGMGIPGMEGSPALPPVMPQPMPIDPMSTEGMFPGDGTALPMTKKPRFVTLVVEMGTSLTPKMANDFKEAKTYLSIPNPWKGVTAVLSPKVLETNPSLTAVAVLHVGADRKLFPSVGRRLADKKNALQRDGDQATAEKYLDLADWTLRHGLLDDYIKVMEEMAEKHESHPAVASYKKIHQQLNEAKIPDNMRAWQAKLPLYKSESSTHYVLFHNQPVATALGVKSHLDYLEKTYRIGCYWFARRGQMVPSPQQKMMAVLTFKPNEYTDLHGVLGGSLRVEDGFFVRRHNLSILSGTTQNDSYEALEAFSSDMWQKSEFRDRDRLLQQRGRPKDLQEQQARSVAMMLQVLESRGARASCSHLAGRQFLFSAGLLPSNVRVPEWVQFGMGSFLESPVNSPWASPTGPSALYLPMFKELKQKNKLETRASETLQKVITNAYFRKALDAEKEPDQEELDKARSSSWALTYFLAHRRFEDLLRYYKALGKMPRDLELSEPVLLETFARAFDLWNAETNTVDKRKFDILASQWYDDINRTFTEGDEIFLSVKDAVDAVEKALKNPKAVDPNNPMGVPGDPMFQGTQP